MSLIAGSLLLGCGVFTILSLQPYLSLVTTVNPALIPALLVGLGAFISITATTGFCLACNVRKGIVYIHITLLLLVFVAIVSGGVLLLVFEVTIVESLSIDMSTVAL